jgi:hypothetical protein
MVEYFDIILEDAWLWNSFWQAQPTFMVVTIQKRKYQSCGYEVNFPYYMYPRAIP